jgi:hypothetical protein
MTSPSTQYALIDGAMAAEGLQKLLDLSQRHACLYMGESAKLLASVAPHLAQFEADSAFYAQFVTNGLPNYWGMLVHANCTLVELVHHFRKFLIVDTEDDRKLYFRFYDPRVLPGFLATASEKQLAEFFGPVSQFTCAASQPGWVLQLQLKQQTLHQQAVPLTLDAEANPLKAATNTMPQVQPTGHQPASEAKAQRKFIF